VRLRERAACSRELDGRKVPAREPSFVASEAAFLHTERLYARLGSRQVLGILDDYRTFWIDPDEGAIEEFEYLMAGK
jgi:hypothetical protein